MAADQSWTYKYWKEKNKHNKQPMKDRKSFEMIEWQRRSWILNNFNLNSIIVFTVFRILQFVE